MYVIIVSFVIVATNIRGEGILDERYETLKLCEAARTEAVEAFREHVKEYGTIVLASQCGLGIEGEPI